MIKVAVIENESELQRYGHANVVEKLRDAFKEAHDILFFSFTSANIGHLFNKSEDGLLGFDGLFISTNALSDLEVLSIVRKEKELICEFISLGKGIFIGYQKKLNIETEYFYPGCENKLKEIIKKNTIDFLPDEYQYYMPEAYAEINETEEDNGNQQSKGKELKVKKSKDGDIELSNYEDILLNYPIQIDRSNILDRCHHNDFNDHVYKSHLQFKWVGSYNI